MDQQMAEWTETILQSPLLFFRGGGGGQWKSYRLEVGDVNMPGMTW